MNIYIFLVVYIWIIWCITHKKDIFSDMKASKKQQDFFLIATFIPIFFLSAFRGDTVGADTRNYILYYNIVGALNWCDFFTPIWDSQFYTTEKGYMILEKVCSDLYIPSQGFLGICAFIYLLFMYKFLKENIKNNLFLAICTFIAIGSYLMSLNVMRQAIGVSICCYAWGKLKEKHVMLFILLVLLACSFHISCCIFFIALFFEKISANKRNLIGIFLVCSFLAVYGREVVQWLLNFFPVYASRYGLGRWAISEANGIVFVWFIMSILIYMVMCLFIWSTREHKDFEILLFNISYLCVSIIGLYFDGMERMSVLFQPFVILLFDRTCDLWKKRTRRIYEMLVIVGMLILFIRSCSTTQYIYIPFWQ